MSTPKKTFNRAISKILEPLIQLMLKNDVSHSEFSELARRAYVKVAFDYFSIPGRKKSNSRVSVITGLSRPEVIRLAKLDENEEPITKGTLNRATQVIGGWLQDEDFTDEQKQARTLPLRGKTNSFEDLVNRYSGGITARAILDELVRVSAVTVINKQNVKLNHQGYVPSSSESEMIEMVSKHAGDMLGTIVHNVSHDADERFFQRQVSYTDIPESVDKEFQNLCHKKSMAMILELNEWLAEKKKTTKEDPTKRISRVGLGIYYFKNEKDIGKEKS